MPYDTTHNPDGTLTKRYRPWTKDHRFVLWQLIEAGLQGVEPGNLISKHHENDLREAGYSIRGWNGLAYSTPKGEAALREGLLNG